MPSLRGKNQRELVGSILFAITRRSAHEGKKKGGVKKQSLQSIEGKRGPLPQRLGS